MESVNLSNQMKIASEEKLEYNQKQLKKVEDFQEQKKTLSEQTESLQESIKHCDNAERESILIDTKICTLERNIKLNDESIIEKKGIVEKLKNRVEDAKEVLDNPQINLSQLNNELKLLKFKEDENTAKLKEEDLLYQQEWTIKMLRNKIMEQVNLDVASKLNELSSDFKESKVENETLQRKMDELKGFIKKLSTESKEKLLLAKSDWEKKCTIFSEKERVTNEELEEYEDLLVKLKPKQQELLALREEKSCFESEIDKQNQKFQKDKDVYEKKFNSEILELERHKENHSLIMTAEKEAKEKTKEEIKLTEKTKRKHIEELKSIHQQLGSIRREELILMAHHYADNVYTKAFTPREYQVELLAAAKERNIIVCLGNGPNKVFISLKLIQELGNVIRRPYRSGGKRTVFITSSATSVAQHALSIKHLTDFTVGEYCDVDDHLDLKSYQVLVMTSEVALAFLLNSRLKISDMNLLILDDCHFAIREHPMQQIVEVLLRCSGGGCVPKVLGLTSPLVPGPGGAEPGQLEAEIQRLEAVLQASAETASDIVSSLRYCAKPKEVVLECADYEGSEISSELEGQLQATKEFLEDHRYNPSEIYDEEFMEDLLNIPNPKEDPNSILADFLHVLFTMGPWCADKAALVLLNQIEKLKVKTPYERHFLLLCMVSSVMLKIRAICDYTFQEFEEKDKIYKFSSPKILRLLEAILNFKPKSKPVETETNCLESEKVENGVLAQTNNNINQNLNDTKENLPHNGYCETNNDTISGVVLEDSFGNKCMNGYKLKNKMNQDDVEGTGRGGRWRGRGRGWRFKKKSFTFTRFNKTGTQEDVENFSAIIFVENPFTAKILFHLFNELRKCDPDFAFVSPQFTVSKVANPVTEPREAEIEHRKQEEVLKRFRMRKCNLLISTSILEEGIDLPKCNLVICYDVPTHYRSYAQSKGRARAQDSHFLLMVEQKNTQKFVSDLAQFVEIERMLLARCTNREPSEEEEAEADKYNHCVPAYCPGTFPVTMSSAIAVVNRYCAKLPSDPFTRLTPLWSTQTVVFLDQLLFYCTLRLPINSPVKQDIIGHPMPSTVLAKRIAALEACRVLHHSKELNDNLQPVGKESFQSLEEEKVEEEVATADPLEPRPGTTKRRQYYYKRIASSLSNCRPTVREPARLYHLEMVLTCPLPEEQNTRGRKLHPPEDAPQGFGILTLKTIPKICPFPIFTRSGEVRVSLELCQEDLMLSEDQLEMIATFVNYTFTSVLRLQKYLMLFDPNASENSYLIVPTKKGNNNVLVDWEFLELIYSRREEMPHIIPDTDRESFLFDADRYHDAVVMPWYRNQDQPQYFYVAEICNHLNPKSSFPGSDYQTFEEYYQKKYGIMVQNSQQPLLDVDHTSARFNFLTPRYVNRKGVALQTSSEETKRAKRENLEQKQILVPELCMIHPFPASLLRQAVCLPCVLYRINALLLADEIRTTVAREIGLGQLVLASDFEWRPLDFGWSLADVPKKSKEENEKIAAMSKAKSNVKILEIIEEDDLKISKDPKEEEIEDECDDNSDRQENEEKDESWMEIGTWSNEMAEFGDDFDPNSKLPANLSMVRYGSPTSWDYGGGGAGEGTELCLYDSDVESELSSTSDVDSSSGQSSDREGLRRGRHITFKGDYLAEAEDDDFVEGESEDELVEWQWQENNAVDLEKEIEREMKKFEQATKTHKEMIENSGMLIPSDTPFVVNKDAVKDQSLSTADQKELGYQLTGYGMPADLLSQVANEPVTFLSNTSPEHSALDSDSDLSDEHSDNVGNEDSMDFSFDTQPDLKHHPGPSPSVLLQALTMSNANDGINLERLETIGDCFLKYAITTFLYCSYEAVHEGKLNHLRSKQVSNLNLYRLGKRKLFGESMIATKFEPHDNWLPPCYLVPRELERALIEAGLPACLWNQAEIPVLRDLSREEIIAAVKEQMAGVNEDVGVEDPCFVPYNLITQHSIPDKSIADCVEALIGAYLIACGPRGALLFMSWLGIRVLPTDEPHSRSNTNTADDQNIQVRYGYLSAPRSPLLRHVSDPEAELSQLLDGFSVFEDQLRYHFQDRSYLLQAMTHASYSPNRLTNCYQRLEFLGDAVLDYLITRHLYEDKRQHCPGALTDLRSALVNNTIFASLAVRHGFHKFLRHLSPGLAEVVERFVRIQEENSHAISEEYYLIGEEECEEAEDVEVPKALGDVFESVAGAIFLDSSMSLDAVWKVYYRMMKTEIEQFSTNVPKSPIRELLELEPETAKFGKPEKLADGGRVRVTVEVFGKGEFKGIGRNYRIAKCTAAKCALKQLKKRGLLERKLNSTALEKKRIKVAKMKKKKMRTSNKQIKVTQQDKSDAITGNVEENTK